MGGTSAWSGGMVWIPDNHHMAELGLTDSREQVMQYQLSMSHGVMDPGLVGAFVDAGPQMVRYLEQGTRTRF